MKFLPTYVDQQNRYAVFFKGKTYDAYNLSRSDIKDLLDRLECDLSPENLCCDGELRGKALQQKSKLLYGAKSELESLL